METMADTFFHRTVFVLGSSRQTYFDGLVDETAKYLQSSTNNVLKSVWGVGSKSKAESFREATLSSTKTFVFRNLVLKRKWHLMQILGQI